MPVVDTELLFALSPADPRHERVLQVVRRVSDIKAADTSILEFQIVLRGRGRTPIEQRRALLALNQVLADLGIAETKTIDTNLLALQAEIEAKYGLSYFDSLIAASALTLDGEVLSDDTHFDRISGLRRRPLSQ